MATVKIRGASDDLIEIEGDICEEFNPSGGDPSYLAFSDGTILQIQYGANSRAFWRITPIRYGTARYEKVEATDEDKDYSDRVTLTGDIKWACCGYAYAVAHRRSDEA